MYSNTSLCVAYFPIYIKHGFTGVLTPIPYKCKAMVFPFCSFAWSNCAR